MSFRRKLKRKLARKGSAEPKQRRVVSAAEIVVHDAERDETETYLPYYGGVVRHRRRVPFTVLKGLERRFLKGRRKRDERGFLAALLAYLLIEPEVDEETARKILDADAVAATAIVGPVVGAEKGI